MYLDELADWLHNITEKIQRKIKIHIDMLHQPTQQHISILPENLKLKTIEKMQKLIKTKTPLFSKEDINGIQNIFQSQLKDTEKIIKLRKQLKEDIQRIDRWRKENFFSIFPDFLNHL